MSKRVLVTGASGHIGGMMVRDLVENGYSVRASVRDTDDPLKTGALRELGVEIVRADLMDIPSMEAACEGMDGLFQVAAVFDITPNSKAQAQAMIDIGIQGAENALRAASKAGIKRVVLTSSVGTIGPVDKNAPPANEEIWVDDISVPYIKEKTLGEKHAWKIANKLGLDMVTVLPATVYGPGFNRSSASVDSVVAIAKGAVRLGAPAVDLAVVDVRDVATVHRLAFEKGTSGGRYIAWHSSPSIYDLALAVNKAYPKAKKPLMIMPTFMTGVVPYIDAAMSVIAGYPRTYPRALHKSWIGRDWRIDDSKSRKELGFEPTIGLEQSIADTVEQLRAIGRL